MVYSLDLKKYGGIFCRLIFNRNNVIIFIGIQKERTNVQDSFCTFFACGLSVRDGNGMKEWEEASITIEAAIIMSMAMLLFLIVMKLGLQLYGETRTLAEDVIKEETLNALKLFYEIERVKGLF